MPFFFKSKKTNLDGLKKVVLDRGSTEAGLYDLTVLCLKLPVHRVNYTSFPIFRLTPFVQKVAMNVRDQFEAVVQSDAKLKSLSSVKLTSVS